MLTIEATSGPHSYRVRPQPLPEPGHLENSVPYSPVQLVVERKERLVHDVIFPLEWHVVNVVLKQALGVQHLFTRCELCCESTIIDGHRDNVREKADRLDRDPGDAEGQTTEVSTAFHYRESA